MLNANPFSWGVANLGWQCLTEYLLDREINVLLAFADTIGRQGRTFLNGPAHPESIDVIGVSVPFEDTYLNVLRMLQAVGLPLLARDRGDELPIVVLGGMSMINPIPLERFADVVVIGEGREAVHRIVKRRAEWRAGGRPFSKPEFLLEIAALPGVYIPSHYDITLDPDGYVEEFACRNGHPLIDANIVLDLTQYPITSKWTSEYALYEYDDYFSVMAAMGCHKKCPFCVVGHIQGSSSGRAVTIDVDAILELALRRRAEHGTNLVKIFFSSAFSPEDGDISSRAIKDLLVSLHRNGFHARVGSLNVKQADEELFQLVRAVGQGEVTLAPETVQELRPSLGKAYITDDKLRELAGLAGRLRLDLNIYSLGSLPGETDSHTRSFGTLIHSLRQAMGTNGTVYVHYNPAFMKAQTPYEYLGNTRPAEARRKYGILRGELDGIAGIEYVTVIEDPMLYYQPILALGDYNSSSVLLRLMSVASPTEDDWQRAFDELGLSDLRYFSPKDPTRRLPWEHIGYVGHEKMKKRAAALMKPGRPPTIGDFLDLGLSRATMPDGPTN
jgi:radical SAM superfamily enzyme YgiQ (UPF0313 family)